jgi:hypothetical protein
VTGDLMRVDPKVIDLGWGAIKTAIVKLTNDAMTVSGEPQTQRAALVDQYVIAFRQAERGAMPAAAAALKALDDAVRKTVVSDRQAAIIAAIDGMRATLT